MLGKLPRALEVGGKRYEICADWSNILTIISAYNDPELRDAEKVFICLRRLYKDFFSIPRQDYEAAMEAATRFIECEESRGKPGPRLVDWEKDEQLIFPAMNSAAGFEIRERPNLHWWTFLGYFQNIPPESICGTVMVIRNKRKRHKKLEKYEQEFYNANRALCEMVPPREKKQAAYDYMDALFEELRAEGGKDDNAG